MRIRETDVERLNDTVPIVGEVGGPEDRLILKETHVEVEISGAVARVRMKQVFQNPYPERLEAVYVFPLPEDAAVDAYSFQFGETVVDGVVKKREEARQEYEKARDDGRKSALLEEERANIFTQSVANIPAGGEISVHIAYVHPVKIDGGDYAFRFPMVVAPRYIPGSPVNGPSVGRGWSPDTDQVAGASRITPDFLPPGTMRGNDVFISMQIDAGMPIQKITAVTHELEVEQPTPTTATVQLKNKSTIANKDFVVEYKLAGEKPVLATLAHRDEGDAADYLTLVLQPKRDITDGELTARDVVLVLDVSGSMNGPPISQLRIMTQHILAKLNPQDNFRVVVFNNQTYTLRDDALRVSPENIALGQDFVRALRSGGETALLPALKTALQPTDGEASRPVYLFLLTDALVGNDDAILGYLNDRHASRVRLFPVAIGAAPNHYLMERAAEIGRGFSMHVTNEDNAVQMAQRFNEKMSTPYMTDLELDWGVLDVEDVLPTPLPDLYAGEPLVILARYEDAGESDVTLKANLLGQAVSTTVKLQLPETEAQHDSLASIWAWKRIR